MRKAMTAAACVALLAAIAVSAPAKAAGTVNLNYWLSDLSSGGEKFDQNSIALSGVVGVPSTQWSGIGEYLTSGGDTDSANTLNAKSKRYLLGARYDFEGGLYATLAYQKNEIDARTAAGNGSIDSDGLRIGGGYDFVMEGTPWSGNIDLGIGVANDASESGIIGSETADSTEMDVDLKVSYKFGYEGLKANLGYRYQKIKAKWAVGSDSYKYDGFYLGAGYDFK